MSEFMVVPFSSLSKEQKLETAQIGWKPQLQPGKMAFFDVKFLLSRGDFTLVLLKDKKPMGYVKAEITSRFGTKRVTISQLFTRTNVRSLYRETRKTAGDLLAEAVLKKAIKKGCTQFDARLANKKKSGRMLQRYVGNGRLVPVRCLNPARKRYRIRLP